MKEEEVADIKQRKLFLEWCVKSMQADVDNYLTLAEENNDICIWLRQRLLEKPFPKRKSPVKDLDQAIVITFLILLDFWTKIDYCLFFLSFC